MPPRKRKTDSPTRIPDSLRDLAVPLVTLNPYHKNPRRGDVPVIRESLRRNGQYRPIVVNKGTHTGRLNEILAGNHTYTAAKAEGWEDIAVTWVDVDDDQAARLVLIDNRASDKATNDSDVLAEVLGSMDDLIGTGYTDDDLSKLLGGDDADTSQQLPEATYAVIIDCDDEEQQFRLLEQLEGEGLNARPLMM